MDTRPMQARGLSVVTDITQAVLHCGWQEFDHINDNGIDGILIERKKGIDTGSLFYVQVKCGDGYARKSKKRSNFLEINVGEEYINNHRERWNAIKEPVILIYVEFTSKKAWWTDLKSEASYCPDENKSIILVPRNQRFGEHSMGELRKLKSYFDLDRDLEVIYLSPEEYLEDTFTRPSKLVAKQYYKDWAQSALSNRTNLSLGEVSVSRVGWRYMSQQKRKKEKILQSFKLLGAAKRMVLENHHPITLRSNTDETDNSLIIRQNIALRSRIVFKHRQEGVVQVILRRKRVIDKERGNTLLDKLWFYSVHELRRGKQIC